MPIPSVRLTRLEAVNRILRAGLGASPILTLTPPIPAEGVAARELLDDVHRSLSSDGWDVNVEDEVDLEPDVDGFVYLPANAIRATYQVESRGTLNVVPRGGRLFNATDQTFVFDATVTATVLRLLDFEDLEFSLQAYVVASAARRLQSQIGAEEIRLRTLALDEQIALASARRADNDSARYNILAGPDPAAIVVRNRSRIL